MFSPWRKVLCAAALATIAFAQDISIVLPGGSTLSANSHFVVEIQSSGSTASIQDVGLAIGITACGGVTCTGSTQYLGAVFYNGPYSPASTNGAGSLVQNITAIAPNYFDGPGQITAAYLYLAGEYATPELTFATANIIVTNASG